MGHAGRLREAVARAQLRTWAAADAEQASRCASLLDRLVALAAVRTTATEAELAAALGTGTPATAERAARLLHARAPLTPELLAALTAAVARVDPDFDSNEDALRSDGRSRVVAARTLLAHTQAPPPAAFTVAMAHGSAGNATLAESVARRSASLQAAYFMLAARSLGLDCGPMAGFDIDKVNEAFFAGTTWRINFICNLGHGDPTKLYPRGPRLDFSEACKII